MKDPAALFYIDKYLVATAEMSADCVGWYTKLILHQYDKGSLPSDIEELASLCNVRFSEFERFKQVYEQVLKQKFVKNEDGRLENEFAKSIISKRKTFKESRSKAGIMGVFIKIAKNELDATDEQIIFLKDKLKDIDYENIEEAKRKHLLKDLLKLYINVNVNKDTIKDENEKKGKGEKPKEISIPDPDEITKSDIFKKCQKFFSQTTQELQMRMFGDFRRIAESGMFKEFERQTLAYIEYKTLSKETKHRWQNYAYEWNSENWIDLLEDFKSAAMPTKAGMNAKGKTAKDFLNV